MLVVDLTADATERIEELRPIPRDGIKTLAFYSHVEADVRAPPSRPGSTWSFPRSRMAREGGGLVDRLLETGT